MSHTCCTWEWVILHTCFTWERNMSHVRWSRPWVPLVEKCMSRTRTRRATHMSIWVWHTILVLVLHTIMSCTRTKRATHIHIQDSSGESVASWGDSRVLHQTQTDSRVCGSYTSMYVYLSLTYYLSLRESLWHHGVTLGSLSSLYEPHARESVFVRCETQIVCTTQIDIHRRVWATHSRVCLCLM